MIQNSCCNGYISIYLMTVMNNMNSSTKNISLYFLRTICTILFDRIFNQNKQQKTYYTPSKMQSSNIKHQQLKSSHNNPIVLVFYLHKYNTTQRAKDFLEDFSDSRIFRIRGFRGFFSEDFSRIFCFGNNV